MARRKKPVIADDLLDQLLAGRDPQAVFRKDGLFDDLKRALAERALNAEMDHHMDGEAGDGRSNSRDGYGKKTLLTDTGKLDISVPRDRLATFDPQLIAKYRRRVAGFDEKIVSMYARGMTVREIRGHLDELYDLDVSPDLISAGTVCRSDAPKIRHGGQKEILGLWIEQTEGAKFWLRVMTELKNRGLEDVLIAVVDGLKGFPDAITAVFPEAQVQNCIVHLIRNSLDFVSYKDRRAVAAALKEVYKAADADAGTVALDAFAESDWGRKIPRHRHVLAPPLASRDPVLRLSRRRPSDHLHHECHRGFERQAAPRRQNPRPFPDRRERHQAALPGLEPGRKGVEDAPKRMGRGQSPVRDPIRRQVQDRSVICSTHGPHTKFLTVSSGGTELTSVAILRWSQETGVG